MRAYFIVPVCPISLVNILSIRKRDRVSTMNSLRPLVAFASEVGSWVVRVNIFAARERGALRLNTFYLILVSYAQ